MGLPLGSSAEDEEKEEEEEEEEASGVLKRNSGAEKAPAPAPLASKPPR